LIGAELELRPNLGQIRSRLVETRIKEEILEEQLLVLNMLRARIPIVIEEILVEIFSGPRQILTDTTEEIRIGTITHVLVALTQTLETMVIDHLLEAIRSLQELRVSLQEMQLDLLDHLHRQEVHNRLEALGLQEA
jgi:hypothetical protein